MFSETKLLTWAASNWPWASPHTSMDAVPSFPPPGRTADQKVTEPGFPLWPHYTQQFAYVRQMLIVLH